MPQEHCKVIIRKSVLVESLRWKWQRGNESSGTRAHAQTVKMNSYLSVTQYVALSRDKQHAYNGTDHVI